MGFALRLKSEGMGKTLFAMVEMCTGLAWGGEGIGHGSSRCCPFLLAVT